MMEVTNKCEVDLDKDEVKPRHVVLLGGCCLLLLLLIGTFFGLLGWLTYLNPTAGLGVMGFIICLILAMK